MFLKNAHGLRLIGWGGLQYQSCLLSIVLLVIWLGSTGVLQNVTPFVPHMKSRMWENSHRIRG